MRIASLRPFVGAYARFTLSRMGRGTLSRMGRMTVWAEPIRF
jgi:hypothetical protein